MPSGEGGNHPISFDCSISTRNASICPAKFTPTPIRTRPGSVGAYSQFTSQAFAGVLRREGIAISMDGRGAWRDNVVVERVVCEKR